jgi:hypothetical protein
MTAYDMRRLLTWACHHHRKGADLKAVIAAAAARKPPFPELWIRQIWPHVLRAAANCDRLNAATPFTRLCDVCDIQE